MERRIFLKNSSQFGIGLSLFGLTACMNSNSDETTQNGVLTKDNAGSWKPFFKLSLAQWSLHKAILHDKTLSPLDFAQKAKELGFDAVEYVNQLYDLGEKRRSQNLNKLTKELKMRSSDNGVTNVQIMIDNEGNLADSEQKERDTAVEKHSKWVDSAAELGCISIRVNLFAGEGEVDEQSWHEASVYSLSRLAGYASQRKINVIVENHGGFSSDAGKLVAVIKDVNMDNCGILPDFGNFCVRREGGARWGAPCVEEYDMYQGVEEMMPYATGVSAKTYNFDQNGHETTIDYYKMMQIVKNSGFNGYVGIEYEGEKMSEEEGIMATKNLLLKVAKTTSKP